MKQHIFGGIDPVFFLACMFFAAMGILLVLLLGTTKRKVMSAYSPKDFSWRYFRSDNAKRIWASVIATIATLRFMPEITNLQLTQFTAFVVGMFWDSIAFIVKQKTNLLDKTKSQPPQS
jgi:uncharacterized membrane-anchored protein